ncbi:MAG TPA: PEP/pyruvate-binding domain-containing protein [Roseiflexaceae bacterium]|nr:PEP/pyruvate-binding domain-containing protein [Roseiflexaceae bacterium]
MELLWLGHPDAHRAALVGGKAAQLSQLTGQHRVPHGFCLTTAAHDLAMRHQHSLPESLYQRLAAAYAALAEHVGQGNPSVAVRSSAADEDGATASFAGQHETFLNIRGLGPLAHAVRRCWESAYAPRALAYRRQHGVETPPRVAVLIQHLVAADVSAVVFSANPITGARDEVLINASWGLGESIVGGTVTPDTYIVRKRDLLPAARHVCEKRRMTVSVSGGTREVDVPQALRLRPALNDAGAAEIAGLAVALEAQLGWPVDIECAFEQGTLYLLQCRPITRLGPLRLHTARQPA